ncbi:MAG: hypothetical protein GY822_29725 [Deltaproteobacteria bacterium]|nr:hypothetical protein [Deltaproteobacteria bacterium]
MSHQAATDIPTGQLQQDRDASSTRGNSRPGGNGGGTNGFRPATHGLDDATNKKGKALIQEKMKTTPPRQSIPDDAVYCIKIDGKEVAVYCRHCGRFGKGKNAHKTTEHTGSRRFNYGPTSEAPIVEAPTKDAPAQAPAPGPPVSGNMAAVNANLSTSTMPNIDPNSIPIVDHPEGSGLNVLLDSGANISHYQAHAENLEQQLADYQLGESSGESSGRGLYGMFAKYLNF